MIVLLAEAGSEVVEDRMAILVYKPTANGVTTTEKLVPAPMEMVPSWQTTRPAELVVPAVVETNVALAGSVPVTVTLEARLGPRLEIASV